MPSWKPPKIDARRRDASTVCKFCDAKPDFAMRFVAQTGEVPRPATVAEVRLVQKREAKSYGAWMPEWACAAHLVAVRDFVGGMDVVPLTRSKKQKPADAGDQQRWPW